MDKTVTIVVKLVTAVDRSTLAQNKDHQPLTEDHIERYATLIRLMSQGLLGLCCSM